MLNRVREVKTGARSQESEIRSQESGFKSFKLKMNKTFKSAITEMSHNLGYILSFCTNIH